MYFLGDNPNDMIKPRPILENTNNSYLEGPKSRTYEFTFAVKVFLQFIKGFRRLHFIGPCITVFGSARFKEDHPYYQKAREVGRAIAELGFTVMTGGGPGDTTELVAVNLYRIAFQGQWRTGYASALAYIILVVIIAISNVYIRNLNKVREG